MNRMALLALLAVILGALLAMGDASKPAPSMSLRAKAEGRYVQVTIRLPDIDESYRTLSVALCSAVWSGEEFGGRWICDGNYSRESAFQLHRAKPTQYVEWQNVPAATVLITAAAFDVNGSPIVSKTVTVFLRA